MANWFFAGCAMMTVIICASMAQWVILAVMQHYGAGEFSMEVADGHWPGTVGGMVFGYLTASKPGRFSRD